MSMNIFSRDVGTLQDAIEYFNSHPHLFEREDYDKGHMERVMAVLTQQNMQHLQKEFQLYPRGLELPTFIYLIKKLYIPDHQMSKYFFVSDLIKFFQSIDINGDGHLQWSQFTEYIIQNIRVVEKPRYKNKAFEQNQIISTAYSKISNEYRLTKIYDISSQSTIKKIMYYEQMQNYYVIESQTYCIRIFNKKFQQVDCLQLQQQNKKSTIVDFSIDKANGIVGCIFQDSLFFSNVGAKTAGNCINRENSICYKKFDKIQYLPHHKTWCISSKNGQLQLFNVSYHSRTLINFKVYKNLHPHQCSLTQILQTDDPMCIGTSSMDGNIKLYSRHLDKYYTFQHIPEQTSSIINENKKKGILGLSYSNQFGNYILTFGFSNSLHIYSLDISMTKGYVGKYAQHTGSILWAKFVKGYPNVLSFDDKMNMRVWDFRKFQTLQFINCEKIFINPSRLQIIPQLCQILITQKKITQFRAPALQKKSKQINQFHNIFDFKFSPLTNQLFIFTSNDVRVYNYFTGSLKKLFTKLYQSNCQTNITASQFGFKCRRFFIGDAGGFVRQFCSETGEQLQNIGPNDQLNFDNKEICKILFLKYHALLVCCSADGRVMIYERNDSGEFNIVRDLRECHEELLVAAVSERYCLLATAGDNGDLFIWSLEKYMLESVCVLNSKPIGITFSPIHPIMIVATQDGFLNFFHVKPYEGKQRYKCFSRVSINQQNTQNMQKPFKKRQRKITSFSCQLIINAYFPKQCELTMNSKKNHHLIAAIGTNTGQVIIVNLNKIIESSKIEQNHQIFVIKNCHRCQVQTLKTVAINQRNRVLMNGYSNLVGAAHYLNEMVHSVIDVSQGNIQNVLISKQSSAIFCKSSDKKLRVYSLKNEYNGAINFLTFKKIFWKIPEVNFFKKIQSIETTIYSIKLIQNKKFQPQQQTKVKVHLLLNQYLSNKQKQHYFNWLTSKKTVIQQQKIVKPKLKKIQNNDCLTQQEFNQIYNKLKNSIEKSLQNQNNNDRIFWERPLLKNKGKMAKQSQITESSNRDKDDMMLVLDDGYKMRSRERKNTKRDQNNVFKIKTKSSMKFDPCFELFGRKSESPKKKLESKKKNMLFTPLSTAKKIIMSNFSGTFYR